MLGRLGSALILIGIVVMVVFLVTSTIGQADLTALLAGAGISALGLLLRRRQPQPEERSERFRTLRRLFGTGEEQEAED